MARYGKTFKNKAVARVLPPHSQALEVVARHIGIGAGKLERWRDEMLALPAGERGGSASTSAAATRFDAVLTTATMDEASKSAWCRANGVYPQLLVEWRQSCTQSLAESASVRARPLRPQQARQDRSRIKELERVAAQGTRAGRMCSALGAVKKSRGDLQQVRGRMIVLEDRRSLTLSIQAAHEAGARLHAACATAGVSMRTLQRWQASNAPELGEGRPSAMRPQRPRRCWRCCAGWASSPPTHGPG